MLMPEGARPHRAILCFTVRVDACPVKLYYAHHIQDLTARRASGSFRERSQRKLLNACCLAAGGGEDR